MDGAKKETKADKKTQPKKTTKQRNAFAVYRKKKKRKETKQKNTVCCGFFSFLFVFLLLNIYIEREGSGTFHLLACPPKEKKLGRVKHLRDIT